MKYNSPSLKWGLHSDFLPKRLTLQGKPWQTLPQQGNQKSSTVIKSWRWHVLLGQWERHFNPIILSNHEKNIRQIPVEGHSTKYLTRTPQNYQGYQKEDRNHQSQEEATDTWQLNVMDCGWEPRTEKEHSVKTKYELQLIILCKYQFILIVSNVP